MQRLSLITMVVLVAACSTSPQNGGDLDGSPGDGGAGSCGTCFVHGRWKVDNLSPCFNTSLGTADGGGDVVLGAVSTTLSGAMVVCPMDLTTKPTEPWSTDTLTVDCPGHYRL